MPQAGKPTRRMFRLIGNDWAKTNAFAKMHEHDRLWSVTFTGKHPLAHLRPSLHRTLNDAIKVAFEMSGNTVDKAWFRREHDSEQHEPLISMLTVFNDKGWQSEVLAYIEPVYLAFSLPDPKPAKELPDRVGPDLLGLLMPKLGGEAGEMAAPHEEIERLLDRARELLADPRHPNVDQFLAEAEEFCDMFERGVVLVPQGRYDYADTAEEAARIAATPLN